jgi:AraC-like DNA-binding protein
MARTLEPACPTGLERSRTGLPELLRLDRETAGLQRAEVQLRDTAFARHRHAEYALGITTGGVQTFRYRGARQVCLPGQLHLLHPDEPHDGAPLKGEGLRYRIVYIAPNALREACPTGRLPFVAEPVHAVDGVAAPLGATLGRLLRTIGGPMDDLAVVSALTTLADGLLRLTSGAVPDRPATIDLRAVRLAADHLVHHRVPTADALERLCGLDRYTLTRHFKAAYGTTPDRYRLLHHVRHARTLIGEGRPLASAAVEAGFADQSHLTRHFTRTYGLTPGRWRALLGGADPPPNGRNSLRRACDPGEARPSMRSGWRQHDDP